MELNLMSVTCCLLALAAIVSSAFSIPIDSQGTDDMHLEEKRPKYMDTRDLDFFTKLVYVSLKKLAEENKINPFVLTTDMNEEETGNEEPKSGEKVEKRRRYLRLCARRRGSRLMPYPCWRSGSA